MFWLLPIFFALLWGAWMLFGQGSASDEQSAQPTPDPPTACTAATTGAELRNAIPAETAVPEQNDLATDIEIEDSYTATAQNCSGGTSPDSLSAPNVGQVSNELLALSSLGTRHILTERAGVGSAELSQHSGDDSTSMTSADTALLQENEEPPYLEATEVKIIRDREGEPHAQRPNFFTPGNSLQAASLGSAAEGGGDENGNQGNEMSWTREHVNICVHRSHSINVFTPTSTDSADRFSATFAWDEESMYEHPVIKRIMDELEKVKRENQELNTRTQELNTRTQELNTRTQELSSKTQELHTRNQELNTQFETTEKMRKEMEQKASEEKKRFLDWLEKLTIEKERLSVLLARQQESAEVDNLKKELQQQKKDQKQLKKRVEKLHTTVTTSEEEANKRAEERKVLISLLQKFVEDHAATERKLDEMRSQHETKTEALSKKYEDRAEKDHKQVSKFIVRLEPKRDKRQILEDVLQDGKQRAEIKDRLDKDLNVRLLRIDGFRLTIEAHHTQWHTKREMEREIQNKLIQLLPVSMRHVEIFLEIEHSSAEEDISYC